VTRAFAFSAAAALWLAATGCLPKLAYHRETNRPLPAKASPFVVQRTGLAVAARDGNGAYVRWIREPVGYLLGLAGVRLPAGVVERNRRKLEHATGGYRGGGLAVVRLTEDPFPNVDVIVALSGGGMRAANLSGAVLYELSRVSFTDPQGRAITLLDAVDTISSVSGSSFAAAYYLYHRPVFSGNAEAGRAGHNRELVQEGLKQNFQRPLLLTLIMPHKISTYVRLFTYASRTTLYSNMIEYEILRPQRIEYLQTQVLQPRGKRNPVIEHTIDFTTGLFSLISPIDLHDQYLVRGGRTFEDLYLKDPKNTSVLYPLRPEWVINSAVYNEPNDRNGFLFDEETFNRSRSDWMRYRVSDAVSASAAFPVLFTPVAWRDWSAKQKSWFFLYDGGVSDNLGLNGVSRAMARARPPRPTVVILVDAFTLAGKVERRTPERPGLIELSARALDRYMSDSRSQTIEDWKQHAARENFRFFHLSIIPEGGEHTRETEPGKIFQQANRISTGLGISRKDQETLFDAARVLVEREKDAIVRGILHPTPRRAAPPAPPGTERQFRGPEPGVKQPGQTRTGGEEPRR
jgi:hypothetical protein